VKPRAFAPAALAVAVLVASAAQPSSRFTLAIARSDGALVPFAAYDHGRWQRAWPAADENVDPTPTLTNMPSVWRERGEDVPRLWHVWPVAGGNSVEARVQGVDVVQAQCLRQVALKTDLPPRKAQSPMAFGVAADGEIPLQPIATVETAEPAWQSAERAIAAAFDALERTQAAAGEDRLIRESPLPPVHIVSLSREIGAPSPMYVVARRAYRTSRYPGQRQCGAVSVLTSWLVLDSGSYRLVSPRMFLTDCDEKTARSAWPLAAMHVGDRAFWVLQEHGYESEVYAIEEIGAADTRRLVQRDAGGC
jgi:hypothetical protein